MKTARRFDMIRNERGGSRMATEAQRRANKKYAERMTRPVMIKLNLRTDADIIEKLDSVENRQGYLKQLIRQDIEASQK